MSSLLWAAALCAGIAFQSQAQPAPLNDDFANAQGIIGISGTVLGTNLSATAEPGEPVPVAGNPAQSSIWYAWTAPITTTIDFNTRGSVDPNSGYALPTVLAVYRLRAGTIQSFANLTKVASNEEDPSGGVTSRVDFQATQGTLYFIQEDGASADGTNAQGDIALNWAPSVVGGTFQFTAATFPMGEYDDEILAEMNGNISPSLHNQAGDANARITITRVGGSSGRCELRLIVTNTFYQNFFETNVTGSNVFLTNYTMNANGSLTETSYTNSYYTNTAFLQRIEDVLLGVRYYVTNYGDFTNSLMVVSNASTGVQMTDMSGSNGVFNVTNFFTNWPCMGNVVNPPVSVTNSGTVTNVTTTQVVYFCLTNIVNEMTPSARDGVDYESTDSTNVTFDDYQMNQDVYLNLPQDLGSSGSGTLGIGGVGGPDYPDANGNYLYYGVNALVELILTNVPGQVDPYGNPTLLDPLESLDIVPPTISRTLGTATMNVENFYSAGPPTSTNLAYGSYVVMNFERATFRADRSVNDGYVTLYVYREPEGGQAMQVSYVIDGEANPNQPIDNNDFTTVAGSDYALPFNGSNPNDWDFCLPYNNNWGNPPGLSTALNPQNGGLYGTIMFPQNYGLPEPIIIPVTNNGAVEFDSDLYVQLFFSPADISANAGSTVPVVLGNISKANVTLNFDSADPGQQAAGSADRTWNVDSAAASYPPYNPLPGASAPVHAMAVQANGQAVIGGDFTSYNSTPINYLARLVANGQMDFGFANGLGSGPNGAVRAIAIDSLSRIYIGGDFTSVNGTVAGHIARLNPNGTLDTNFVTHSGFNYYGTVLALALDANGNIVVGGNFSSFNTTNCANIARLMTNGALDTSFLPSSGTIPGMGTDQQVRAVALDSQGNIVLGGDFLYVNGTNWSHIGRLLPSGALDTSFNPGFAADKSVYSLAVQPNNNSIILAGAFQNYNLITRGSIARITSSGALDTTFDPGIGANDIIYSVLIEPTGNIDIGGQFTVFNTVRRVGMARLFPNGWLDTYFMDTAYNQYAGLINHYYNTWAVNPNDAPAENNQRNYINAMALDSTGNLLIGGSFVRIGGGFTRDDVRIRLNMARVITASNTGPEPQGGTGNCPGNITLTLNPYTVDDTAGKLYVGLDRTNGSLGPAAVTLGTNTIQGGATQADFGLATPSAEYIDIWQLWSVIIGGGGLEYGWRQSDGYWGYNYTIQPAFPDSGDADLWLKINNNTSIAPGVNLFAGLSLLNLNSTGLLTLGGATVPTLPALGQYSAGLEIVNDNYPKGVVGFALTNYVTLDTNGDLYVTVTRTNGNTGDATAYWTSTNGTAVSTGSSSGDYQAVFGTASFSSVNTTVPIKVHIYGKSTLVPTKYFGILITNVTGAALDTNVPPQVYSSTTVQIIDGLFQPGHLEFSSPSYTALKGSPATVTVNRLGGAKGQLDVYCAAANGTAINGVNYSGVTNLLAFADGSVTPQTMTFPTLQDHVVDGNTTFKVFLYGATNLGVTSTVSNNEILAYPSNATVTIQEINSFGTFNFSVSNFNVMQNASQALITVVRTSGTVGSASVNFATLNGTNAQPPFAAALAGTNYGAASGVLTFAPGVSSQSFVVPIYYTPNETVVTNRIVNLVLFGGSPAAISNQFPRTATLTILDNQLVFSPAGSVDQTTASGIGFNNYVLSLALQADGDLLAGGNFTFYNQYPIDYVARLNTDASRDSTFLVNQAGANGLVNQVLSQVPAGGQTNGNIMLAGGFSQVDQVNRAGIARLNPDGSLDTTFNPGAGADNAVYAVAQQFLPGATTNVPNLAYYVIGGSFENYDGYPAPGVGRLTATGAVDPNFNPQAGIGGSNAAVRAVAIDANNRILLGGDFTIFNNQPHHHLVRLNVDGSLDSSFQAFDGVASDINGSVRALLIQPDGQILIGGSFTNVSGSNYNCVARLNTDGSVDTSFNVGAGCDNLVLAIALDSQNRILLGGEFARASGVTRNGITRLNPDGTVDPTINFGYGANGYVDTIVIQENDEINVGGGFTTFDGLPENNFVRLYGGAISGDGSIEFGQAVYGVLENATNAYISIQRIGGEGTAAQPVVSAVFSTSDGTGINGRDYIGTTNTILFPLGETFETVAIPLINNPIVAGDVMVNLNLTNSTYATIGPLTAAELIITNVNTALAFSGSSYRQSADAPGGSAVIPIVRQGNPNNTVAVTVYTGANGTATPNVNYTPITNTLIFYPGVLTNYFLVPILDSPTTFSDTTVDLEMTGVSNAIVGSPGSAVLTIGAVINAPGTLMFSTTTYTVLEGNTNAIITIVRTNGTHGSVEVTFSTTNGTATAGVNYGSVSTVVKFADTVDSQTVSIPIYQLAGAGPNTTVLLNLSNPTGGAAIGGAAQETLTILNDIPNFCFGSATYFVNEGAGSVTLWVQRNGDTNDTVSVDYSTFSPANASDTNGYAVTNVDYVYTSNTLTFGPGQLLQSVPITILQGKTVNGLEIFQVLLENPKILLPTPATNIQIGSPGVTTVGIICDVTGFAFATNAYFVGENGSNIVITVNRVNPSTGPVSVQFATSDGTAINGVDYAATGGVLNFLDGQPSSSFVVPILNPNLVENSKTFNIALFAPSANSSLLSPSNTVVTITNTYTGLSFGASSFTVSECSEGAAIPVVRTGQTNNTVSVNYATHDGSGLAGTNYFATNGTLTFTPGQTVQTFNVPVINNHVIGPNHTVELALSDPIGAQVLNPSTALLTIQECNGAYIVASGTAFQGGTIRPNTRVIYPNDTVTIAFGLRDIAGNGTTNLVATLLATNGISNVSPLSNSYGALALNGPTAARSFKFTAIGTNGQNVAAVLALQDGTANLGMVAFGFTLGDVTTTFTNLESIIIPEIGRATNAFPPDYGYPSVIAATGVPPGILDGVTVTISNFTHSYPSDVDILLEGPGSQSSVLMSKCGSGYSVTNITLTFSEAASNTLVPVNGRIGSGTYGPTANPGNIMAQLPGPVEGIAEAPLAPYSPNLNTFFATPANGQWLLWVVDTVPFNSGEISNGWILNLSTGIPVEADSDLWVSVLTTSDLTLSNQFAGTITVTNYGPAPATDVVITEPIPPGVAYVSNGCNCGVVANGVISFTLPTLAVNAGAAFTSYFMPTNLGYITNVVTALADQQDPNTNNVATNISVIGPPSADLGLTMTASPSLVTLGGDVTYVITVTNGGPSQAASVTVTDVLPPGFLYVTNYPSAGVTNNNGTITWAVGTLNPAASGGTAPALQIVAAPSVAGIWLNSASVSSAVFDPFKLNNFAAAKVEVDAVSITINTAGASNWLVWPTNYVLQGASNLPPQGTWISITNPAPPVVNGQYNYPLVGTNGSHYFYRLKAPLP